MAEVSSQNAIWQVLDRLRGRVPANEYPVALAALIFLRWADFQDAEQEAIAAFDETEYDPVLPTQYHWRTWCDVHDPRQLERIFDELSADLYSFDNSRHDALATQLYRVAPAVEKLEHIPTDVLVHLIEWLAQQPFETPSEPSLQ